MNYLFKYIFKYENILEEHDYLKIGNAKICNLIFVIFEEVSVVDYNYLQRDCDVLSVL